MMKLLNVKKLIQLISVSLVLSALWSCDAMFSENNGRESAGIVIISKDFTIRWQYDTIHLSDSEREELYFHIYAKNHTRFYWHKIGSIPYSGSDIMEFTINSDILRSGTYDLGVSAEYSRGRSRLHTSQDISADPNGGWHIIWVPSN